MQHDITPRARATRAKGGPLFCSLVMKKIQRHIIRVFVSRSTSNYDMPDKLNHVKRYLFMSNVKERASGGGPPNLIIIIKLSNMENKKKYGLGVDCVRCITLLLLPKFWNIVSLTSMKSMTTELLEPAP